MSTYQIGNRYAVNNPSRFGPTAEIVQLQQMNLNAELALGTNPWLANDPQSLLRIAQSGDDPLSIANNAAALAGMETADSMATALTGLSPVAQRAVWGKLTEGQQRSLQHMGFQPQERQGGGFLDGTPLSGAWDLAADVTGIVTKPLQYTAWPVAKGALDVLTWVGDVPGHFYRAVRQMEGWQQWLALGGAVALAAALPFAAPAMLAGAASMGSLATMGAFGGAALAGGILATAPTAITNTSEWWDVMNPFGANGVGRGERIFTQRAQQQAGEILEGAGHIQAIARDLAAELDVMDIATDFAGVRDANNFNVMSDSISRVASNMADPGTPEYDTLVQGLTALVEQPEFRQAIDTLQSGKISFGRDIANSVGLDQGDFGYGFLSGSMDALWLLTMDPTLALGKIGKVNRLWRRGIEPPTGVDAIQRLTKMVNEDPMVAGLARQVSQAVDEERISLMPKAWRSLYQPMVEYKRGTATWTLDKAKQGFDTQDFLEYMDHGRGLTRMMEGKGTIRGLEQVVISAENRSQGWGRFVASVRDLQTGLTDEILEDDLYRQAQRWGVEADLDKMLVRNYTDEALDTHFKYVPFDEAPINETWGYQTGSAIGKGLLYVPGGRTLGNFIGGVSTMIPAGSALKLTPGSADDFRDVSEDIPRFVESMGRHFNMPSAYRDQWLDHVMRQENVALRRNAVVSFMESIFDATGFRMSEEWSSVADEYILKYKQAYALGGRDVVTQFNNGVQGIRGVYPDLHQAVYMVMPDIREMTKIVRQGHIVKNIARVTDSSFAEQAMSRVIKPGWLLRIGFIPRAAGEEFLAFFLRMTEGGLAQEFAGRTVATREATQKARQKLIAEGGNLNKLTDFERELVRRRLPSHLKPLAAMGERQGWHGLDDSMLDRYVSWTTKARAEGFGLELPDMPVWAEAMLVGKDASIRRMVLSGVDADMVEAGQRWLGRNATSIMRSASASNASQFERSLVNPDVQTVLVDDVKNPGQRKEVNVVLNGERQRVGMGDDRYATGVHHRTAEPFMDEVLAPIVADLESSFLPPSIAVDRTVVAEAYDQLQVIDNWTSKMIVSELLVPRQDNVRATASLIAEHVTPSIADTITNLDRRGQFNINSLIDELDELLVVRRAESAPSTELNEIIRLRERLETVKPTIESLDTMDAASRQWVAANLTKSITGKGPSPEAVRAWASGTTGGAAPRNVYYRGVPDGHSVRYNDDGSLTLVPQPQEQWQRNGQAIDAVSLSTSPHQAMTYASKRTRARNVETGLTEAQDAGAVFMFDADWMNAQYNTTGEALRANPRTYRDTRYEGDGLYLVGREDEPYDFTEIALATDREVTIPAGKWKAMDTGEMWDVQMADEATAGKFWTAGGFEQEIDGTPIPEAASAVNQAFDDFVESLTVDERAFLAEQLEGNFDDLKTWNETTRYGGDGSDDPGAILGDILADEKAGTDYGDDTFNSIARKFEQYLMGDHANAVRLFANRAGGTRNVHRTIDDAIRERIGLSNLNIKVDGVIGHSAIDPLAGKSALNNIVREGFEFRGLGNWENIGDQGWSPFIESFDDLRERMIDEIAAQLHRPENVDFVKRAEQMINLKDGSPVARPPADGVTRIYTPVVPADSSIIDDILVSLDEGSDALRGASVSASRVFRNLPTSDDPVWEAISHVEAMALADDVNGDRWDAIRGELLRRFENGPTENPWEDMADLIEEAEALLSMRPPVKGMTGTPVNSYAEKARRVLARNVATRYADPVIDAMTEEQRIELVGRMLRLYDESKAQYGLGMSQALEGMAFDDPRIAKWLSSLMGNGMDEAPLRVGQLEIPRSSLINNQGYPKTGVRLGGTFGDAGREWQFDARYANRAAPVEAPAFHHVPYEYTDESGLVSKGTDVVVGRSVEEAYRDWAEQIADTVLTSHRRGVREKQVFKGQRQPERQIARRVGDKFEELGEGEVVNGVEDFYAVKDGKVTDPIQFGDNRFFDHVVDSQEDDLMWNILGPMIRDHYEAEAGMSRKVARTFKEHKGMFGRNKPQPLHESLTTDQEVRMTRSRVDDVHNEEGAMLPNVAIVQGYDMLHDTVWDRIVRYGFDKVIGPAIDSIVRKPMAFHYFAAAYKQQKRMFGFLLDRDLFEVSFANEFAPFLDAMRSEAGGLDNVIDQVRLVAKEGWGVELDNVDDVRRWVISASEDSDSWRESLDAVQKQARQRAINASVKRGRGPMNAEGQPEWGLVTAIDDVRDNVNRQAVLMSLRSDGIGARTDAEALVKAYHEAVPEHLWDEGHDAVTGYLRDTDLPSEVTPDQWRVLKQARANMAHALNTAEETATLRAIENVIPYLDSHEQRSLLAEYGRNFVPFWYAEENFLKRWARTFALGQFGVPGVNATIPSGGLDTLRRAQLTYMGIKSAGAIRTDANGEDWVVYPGSSLLTEAVSKILPGDTMPIGVLYAASTDSLLPGLTDENHISPSPFVAMPAHFVAHIFPDARPVKDALLGPIGSQRSIISQFVPSAGQNFWNALFQDEDSSVRYASAMNAAIAYAEAEGNGLPDSASAAQVDEYLDRIRNHARIIMVSQAIAGFVVPGSPRPIATGAEGFDALTGLNVIDPEEITSESYRKYIQELGIEDGTAAFLRAFPNADLEDVINPLAFTSSATESVSRAPLPATEQGVSWYEDNKAWIDASPEAGAWFIPQDGQGEFEYAAYRQQLVNGLRKRRTPQEFIHAIKYRTAAEEYFRRKDQIDVALEQVGDNRDAAKALNSTWDSWQKPFLKAHPIFAEELAIGTARVRRSRTVEQMRYAANDPAAPDSPYLGAIREIVKAYDSFNAAAKALRTRNDADSREMVRGLKGAFSDWGEAWALSNPGLERLWTSVYRLEARIE